MTNTDQTHRKLSQEVEIDHLLVEEFICDPDFGSRFAAACDLEFETLQVLESISQPSLGNGYGDLLVKAEMDGERIAFLIEDKITAGAQLRQAERYKEHANRMRKKDGWNRVLTVLVAPRSYLGERDLYDKSVDLETVAEMLDSPNLRRREYRRGIIARALKKKEATGVQIPDHAMYTLHSDYLDNTERWLLTSGCHLQFPKLKNVYYDNDSWVNKVRHPDFTDHVWLRHRLWTKQASQMGMVDLIVSPALSVEREWLKAGAPEEFIEDTYGGQKQGVKFSLPVMEMRQSTGFCKAAATEAFRRHGTAHRLVSEVRQSLVRILHECANLAGLHDISAVAGRDCFDRAETGQFDAVFGL